MHLLHDEKNRFLFCDKVLSDKVLIVSFIKSDKYKVSSNDSELGVQFIRLESQLIISQ